VVVTFFGRHLASWRSRVATLITDPQGLEFSIWLIIYPTSNKLSPFSSHFATQGTVPVPKDFLGFPPQCGAAPPQWWCLLKIVASRSPLLVAQTTKLSQALFPHQLQPSTFAFYIFKYAPSPTSKLPELRSLLRASSVPQFWHS
jgi:hypothetical protein